MIDSIIPYTDLFMVSLNHFDTEMHKKLTGVSNKQILDNISYLSHEMIACRAGKNHHPKLWLRYVVLPGYTDTKDNLKALVEFLHQINFELIELLPYHTFGVYKWKKLGLKYSLKGINPPKVYDVLRIKKMLEKNGFKVQITE